MFATIGALVEAGFALACMRACVPRAPTPFQEGVGARCSRGNHLVSRWLDPGAEYDSLFAVQGMLWPDVLGA